MLVRTTLHLAPAHAGVFAREIIMLHHSAA